LAVPEIGGNSAKRADLPSIDPRLTPQVLGKKTQWQISLNEE
jgi:hypothetical protein